MSVISIGEAFIRKSMREYIPETTKLIIAQRISSVQDADKIIVLDGGKIIAMGNHAELLESCDVYRETYLSQNNAKGDAREDETLSSNYVGGEENGSK